MKFTLFTANCTGNENNAVYPYETVITSAEDMKEAIIHDHVCAKYRNSHRGNSNFISPDIVPLDCDNDHSENSDDWITPQMLEEAKDTQYFLADIDTLIPYARNARTHSDAQIAQIAASIKEFGFLSPIIIAEDNTILCGHGRFYGAKKLGLQKVPCVMESHLTETQRRAYILADNKLSLNAGWDDEMLAVELSEFIRPRIIRNKTFSFFLIPFHIHTSSSQYRFYITVEDSQFFIFIVQGSWHSFPSPLYLIFILQNENVPKLPF